MANDPYASGLIQGDPYGNKCDLYGSIVAILDVKNDHRGMHLIPQPSRCIRKTEIHELVCTDEKNPKPNGQVDRAAYIGFVEFSEGGVIVAGDEIYFNDTLMGHIAGFDDVHYPNHYDILLTSDEFKTGVERNLFVGGKIRIHKKTV